MLFRLSGLRVRDRWLTKWEEAARQVKLLSILFHQTTSAKKKDVNTAEEPELKPTMYFYFDCHNVLYTVTDYEAVKKLLSKWNFIGSLNFSFSTTLAKKNKMSIPRKS